MAPTICPTRKACAAVNLRNLEYLIQEAFVGIWRNGIMAVASVSTVALSMAILGAFMLLVMGSHRFAENQLSKFEIMAYMPVGADRTVADNVSNAIDKLPLASKVEVLSREKEWSEFKRKLNTDIDLGGVTDNPLPYALTIECKDPHKVNQLAEQIRRIDGVAHVVNAEQTYGVVRAIADLVKVIGFAAVILLTLTTVFIVSNAIRLTMWARRREIQIMQLVGATNWFIRIPLVVEGMVLGAIGSVIAVGLISGGSRYISQVVHEKLPLMLRDMSSGMHGAEFLALLVTGGAVIGALGSFISIRRFLRT